jgi:predicted RNA-binding Zn-ribbon protein involved in translation (DUF1610 family)
MKMDESGIETIRQSQPTARTRHICTTCGRTIEPGERYWSDVHLREGKLLHDKTCRDCQNPYLDG